MTSKILLCLMLLLFISVNSNSVSVSVSDKDTMYNILTSLIPTPSGWSSATTYCSWQGIKCDAQNKVVSIDLASHSLSGSLPTSFNSLTRLTTLCLQHNRFSGDFPSLANLSRLRKLYLHNNSFTSIAKGAFSRLTSLRILNLSNNTNLMPWTFPSDLAASHKLIAIYARNANLIGSIPDIFGSLPELVNLTLSYNNLTGSLPSSFVGSRIQTLKVDNQLLGLTGNIDSLIGINNLSLVWLQGNRFTGIIPSSFVLLPYLSNVRLENNQFQYPIPKFPNNVMVNLGTISPNNSSKLNDDDNANWLFNCRKCKVYIRAVSGGGSSVPVAPQETQSSGKRTNVGAVVVFSILLVGIIVALPVCICVKRFRNRGRAYKHQVRVQMAIPGEENLPKQRVKELVTKEVNLPQSKVVGPARKEHGETRGNEEERKGDKKQVKQEVGGEGKERGKKECRDDKKQVKQEVGREEKLTEGKEQGKEERRDDKKQVKQEGGREGIGRAREEEVKRRPAKEEPAVKEGNQTRLQKEGVVGQGERGMEGNKQPKEEEILEMPRDNGNREGNQEGVDEEGYSSLMLPHKYPFHYINVITNYFDQSNVLGEGAFAKVYRGTLLNGATVAIKRLKLKQGRNVDDFKNEVDALGRTSHFNLVKLIGYCAEDKHRMLVYEFMSNGSLDQWIFSSTNGGNSLTWTEMKRVILGIAKGLVYLHENCHKKILHRDLKPANVLLDKKKNAKLADFGISKLIERDQSSTSTVGMGTPAYVAPEVFNFEKISVKVDVYSFGIVVLETMFGKHYGELVGSYRTHLQPSQLPGLIKNLSDEMRKNSKQIETIGKLAISCLSPKPEDRPTMSDILGVIKGVDIKVRRN